MIRCYAPIKHDVRAVAMGTRGVNDRHVETCPALTCQVACVVEDVTHCSQNNLTLSLVGVHMIGECVCV